MNKELNVFTLRMLRDQYEAEHMDTEVEALEAAISVLETDGDLISRQAAIDELKKYIAVNKNPNHDARIWEEGMNCAVSVIGSLPSAQPEDKCSECDAWNKYKNYPREPQWIPCSERLPEELEEVNVTWVNHKPEPYYDFVKDKPFTASAVYYKDDWYWYSSVCTDLLAERGENEIDKIDDAIEITAWMPLPEPWRGEELCMQESKEK